MNQLITFIWTLYIITHTYHKKNKKSPVATFQHENDAVYEIRN